ncbi:MAG TPA: macro domain-containing protein, partial [Propionibacteriaceae bacterium]
MKRVRRPQPHWLTHCTALVPGYASDGDPLGSRLAAPDVAEFERYRDLAGFSAQSVRGHRQNDLVPNIIVVRGDITTLTVDAIVNTANNTMRVDGGGVDGAIHRAGGPTVRDDCIARFPNGL